MTLNELAEILVKFTNEHYAKAEQQPFFRLMHQLALNGMGVGTGAQVSHSGEAMALRFVRDALQRQFPNEAWSIFDVGANLGQFLSEAMQAMGPGNRHYYCFEPAPETFAALWAKFSGRPEVSMFNFGFGEASEERPLFSNAPTDGLASLYKRRLDHFGIPMNPIATVKIQMIDQFTKEHNVDRIHLLKLDVEGHELKCLQGAAGMLKAGRIQFVQFEMGGTDIDSRTFFQDFWYALPNYKIKRILRDGFCDITRYHEIEEVFLAQNYLACLNSS